MEEEVNLQEYIDVLIRRWKVIVGITATAAIVSALVSFLSSPLYEAKIALLVNQSQSETLSRQTLVEMVKSSTVATQVIQQLEDKLKPKEREPEIMLKKVQVGGQGSFIEILVRDADPQTASAIANAWVEPYERYINSFYYSIAQLPKGLTVQADVAQKYYESKQKAVEDFTSNSHIDKLNQQIADKEMLCNIKSLRDQIEAGSSSSASAAANSLALVLLQGRAFTDLPYGLQISLDAVSNLKIGLGDIDALIATLEARSGGTRGQSISELRHEILQLKGELEKENAKQRELVSTRDIAWNVYIAVARKVADTEIAAPVLGTLVQVIRNPFVPQSPVSPRRAMNIGITLILGLAVSVFGAFVVEYFKKTDRKPERERSP